jgi:Arc/MetJ family transcription regulator
MGRDYIRLRSNREHEKLLAEAKEVLNEDQDSKAIDAALRHLVESHANLEEMKRDLTPDHAEALSTSELSLTMYPQVRR